MAANTVSLRDLLSDGATCEGRFDTLPIKGLAADSRAVKPGYLFVAVPGTKADGLTFLPQALAAGATAVMAERRPDTALPEGVAFVETANVRRALALAAARFYRRQPAVIAAVTGTSGKTSVVAFTRQIWAALGHASASIGTIGLVTPKKETYGSLTTPDPVELHRTLDRIAADGIDHLALEASSHGLDQHRLDGVRVAVAGFTNITRDHLDYHKTFEAYLAAKLILVDRIVTDGGAVVIAADHEASAAFVEAGRKRGLRVVTVGRRGDDIRLDDAAIDGFSQTLRVVHAGKAYRVRLPLVGAFQVENALVAAGHAIATGGDPAAVFNALEGLEGAKGRLELVGHRNGAPVFVDYSHKPDALAKALESLRPYVQKRLVVVFGAGGDRDQGKRPLMGAIAAEKADRVIVTDDNPRSEEPAAIRAAILATAPGALEVGDRREAIRRAVGELETGDVLLVAGKGHETGQIVAGTVLPFSDHEAVITAIKEKA
ncbi:UDP-N-acetylmuramoyl-L-alanyl-D-glutamate--2,6-diaminopimelate ligase [Xanthobacteraceae bacterium Astr-EGSB]|uniref:UDP-N-acetylmuramoyl-L-alanyl-D-glutamate--2, 6-diaminopimelate ligase n=1 Tax=Astrobacterium formosum TaxID=3069710 RepID=UPI0027B06589|nr:UDP-N-acetylmuramoyl-L-alanyl-D-glutamate--2,6-diaminopimelate ligase [Xanthobacteraceae bacterium Astr-EGSB]